MPIGDHQRMVADRRRVDSYRRAIVSSIRPGDVVVDLGTGTGLLAVYAAQAGARRVYGVEWGPVDGTARIVAAANGFAETITIIAGNSRQLAPPEPADWIIGELMGSFGLDEELLAIYQDARRRWLKPGGRLMPGRIAVHAAPATAPRTHDVLSFWEHAELGVDLAPVAAKARSEVALAEPDDVTLLTAPGVWLDVDLTTVSSPSASGELRFSVERPGSCHGFAVWFDAELTPEITLSNDPRLPPTTWATGFIPLPRTLPLTAGDVVSLDLRSVSLLGHVEWSWRWAWSGALGTAQGEGGDDALWARVRRQTSEHRTAGPVSLTDDGAMMAAVLAQCGRGLDEAAIVATLMAQDDRFRDPYAARRWVGRVVRRYGRAGAP